MHALRTLPAIRAVRRTLIAALLASSVAIPVLGSAALAQENGGTLTIDDPGSVTNEVYVPAEPNGGTIAVAEAGSTGNVAYGVSNRIEEWTWVDSDYDGLDDTSEVRVYGTDPFLYDTDYDGLGDGDEISTYGTGPLLYDTDGDGYSDGQEVSMGRSPLFPGL